MKHLVHSVLQGSTKKLLQKVSHPTPKPSCCFVGSPTSWFFGRLKPPPHIGTCGLPEHCPVDLRLVGKQNKPQPKPQNITTKPTKQTYCFFVSCINCNYETVYIHHVNHSSFWIPPQPPTANLSQGGRCHRLGRDLWEPQRGSEIRRAMVVYFWGAFLG